MNEIFTQFMRRS